MKPETQIQTRDTDSHTRRVSHRHSGSSSSSSPLPNHVLPVTARSPGSERWRSQLPPSPLQQTKGRLPTQRHSNSWNEVAVQPLILKVNKCWGPRKPASLQQQGSFVGRCGGSWPGEFSCLVLGTGGGCPLGFPGLLCLS